MVCPARRTSITKRKIREPGMAMLTRTLAVLAWLSARSGSSIVKIKSWFLLTAIEEGSVDAAILVGGVSDGVTRGADLVK